MRVLGHHEPGPERHHPQALVQPLEGRTERLRDHLRRTPVRRPKAMRNQPITPLSRQTRPGLDLRGEESGVLCCRRCAGIGAGFHFREICRWDRAVVAAQSWRIVSLVVRQTIFERADNGKQSEQGALGNIHTAFHVLCQCVSQRFGHESAIRDENGSESGHQSATDICFTHRGSLRASGTARRRIEGSAARIGDN